MGLLRPADLAMRSRILRPELLTDETLGTLPDALVLFYLKLWLLCDDEGYFEWRPRQIAATLYPYRGERLRTHQVSGWLDDLVLHRRVSVLVCGEHAVVPTIPTYRIRGGNQAHTVKSKHDSKCAYVQVRTSPDKYRSESVSESSSDSESGRGGAFKEKVGWRG